MAFEGRFHRPLLRSPVLARHFRVNISIFVGYKLKKVPGGIVCALGSILPSFFIILAIALFFTHVQDNVWVEKAFKGLRPAVVA